MERFRLFQKLNLLLSSKIFLKKPLIQKRNYDSLKLFKKNHIKFDQYFSNFHTTSSKAIGPGVFIFLKTTGVKVAGGFGVLLSKFFRSKHIKLKKQGKVRSSRTAIGVISLLIIFSQICYYTYSHREITPITGRERWVSFTDEQALYLAELAHSQLSEEYHDQIMDKNTDLHLLCQLIVKYLCESNQDIVGISTTNWKINIVDDKDVCNAFVLPNGEVYVFTGLFQCIKDHNELAVILGHEMSHVLLGHIKEQNSYIMLGELLMIPLLTFIWFVFNDLLAVVVHLVQKALYPFILDICLRLPKSRELEREADKVGLYMVSKSCFDPRTAVCLYEKLALKNEMESKVAIEYLSTHPTDSNRASEMEDLLSAVLELRQANNCSELSSDLNPIEEAYQLRSAVANLRKQKELKTKINHWKSLDELNDEDADSMKKMEKELADLKDVCQAEKMKKIHFPENSLYDKILTN